MVVMKVGPTRIASVLVGSLVVVTTATTTTSTTAQVEAPPVQVVTATTVTVLMAAKCREVQQFVGVEPTMAREPS